MKLTLINLDLISIIFFVHALVLQRYTKGIKRLSSSERALIELPNEVK